MPDLVVDELIAQVRASNPFRSLLPPPPPLTRRQRWVGRLLGYRWRVRMAIDVLRDRHDCGDL